MKSLWLYLLLICCLVMGLPVAAESGVSLKPAAGTRSEARLQVTLQVTRVQASLSSDYQTIAPGQTFYVMLTQDIAPGWHTYWRNPGDSGAPTKLRWDLPAGFTAAEIEWPYPERIAYGPLMNFGFSNQLVLLIKMTAPDFLTAEAVTLRAKGQWLVCADVCIPESAALSLALAVGEPQQDAYGTHKLMQARRKQPVDAGIAVFYQVQEQTVSLRVMLGELAPARITQVSYFPYTDGVIENPHPQQIDYFDGGLILSTKVGYDYSEASVFDGVMVLREDAGNDLTTAIVVKPEPAGNFFSTGQPANTGIMLVTAVLLALLGGLILNLMPCVFPVLSIKILSLLQDTENLKGHGLVYTLGIVLSFLVIASILITLKQGGAEIGWGFQLQSPLVVSLLVYLFVLIGLNLSGFFTIGTRLMTLGQGRAHSGYAGAFATGVLATLVAAPCSAPFMATAVGFALTQGTAPALLIFGSLGFGMALPYLLLCYWPPLLKKLPRPGPWMIKTKEFLAFPMYASAVWLLWVVSIQAGSAGVLGVTGGILLLVFSIWLLGSLPGMRAGRYAMQLLALGLIIIAVMLPTQVIQQQTDTNKAARFSGGISRASSALLTRPKPGAADCMPYSEARLAELRQVGPVFVNLSAAWCITCKVNEAVALHSRAVKQAFAEHKVAYLKGDWTSQDPAITRKLAEYQRSGVPLYLLYAGSGRPAEVLPQILSVDIILQALGRLTQ